MLFYMEKQGDTESEKEGDKQEDLGDSLPIFRNIFPAIWLRFNFLYPAGMDSFLLAYSWDFLLPIGSILWIIFLLS